MQAFFELLQWGWSLVPRSSEFWSAIAGAVVGGAIGIGGQLITLRDAKKQRDDDRRLTQQALANALLFKMMRIHGNFLAVLKHVDNCYADAARQGFKGEAWKIVLPLANPPVDVHFSSDEMGMLLGLGDTDTFNAILPMDVFHNSAMSLVRFMGTQREALLEKLPAVDIKGNKVGVVLSDQQLNEVMPKIMALDRLIVDMHAMVKHDFAECDKALDRLHSLLRSRLDLKYTLTPKKPKSQAASPSGAN